MKHMKIHYCSDLHLNKSPFEYPNMHGDVLILAGDICPINEYDLYFKDLLEDIVEKYEHILYIMGNHEFYYGDITDIDKAREYVKPYTNVKILQNESIIIDDIQFLGGTCWTNFNNLDSSTMMNATKRVNDFNRTTYHGHQLTCYDWLELHNAFTNFIRDTDTFTYPNIVITHHSPTALTSSEKFKHNITNGCYCANLEYYMGGIDYWFHGHQHYGIDLELDRCKIKSNSRGYPNEECYQIFEVKEVIL